MFGKSSANEDEALTAVCEIQQERARLQLRKETTVCTETRTVVTGKKHKIMVFSEEFHLCYFMNTCKMFLEIL